MIRERLSSWYPCQNAYRTDLYSTLVLVNNDDAIQNILFQVLRDEQPYNQEAAAIAIADQSSLLPGLSERVKEVLAIPNSLPVLAAALEALLRGWPEHQVWDDLEPRIRYCASIELRLIGIRRRILASRQDKRDLDELLWMVSRSGPFMWRRSDAVIKAFVEGWPGDVAIRDNAIRCINPRMFFEDGLDANAAVRLLITGYSNDSIATTALGNLIRTEEHAFADGHWIWKAISEKYVGNSEMIAAADEWLERWSQHHYPEISFAARLGWTDRAKRKLLEILTAWVPFWAAEALLDRWGMSDPEVAAALNALSLSDKASDIGHLFPRIISDRNECFTRLVTLFESKDCREPGRVLAGLVEVLEPDQRDRILQVALDWAEKRQVLGNRERVVSLLFEHFSADTRVKSLALREMNRREGMSVPALKAFSAEAAVMAQAIRMAAPLPTELRSEIVGFLETNALLDQQAFDLLSLHDLESDPVLKTRAAIGYSKALVRTGQSSEQAIEQFSEALVSGGPHYESRRQAAVCGLDILGRLDLVTSIRESRKDPLPITVTDGGRTNVAFVEYLLSMWANLRSKLGKGFTTTFFRSGADDLDWWSHVAESADNFPEVRETLVSILSGATHEQLYSELLMFLGRVRPRSNLLLEHCLRVIKNQGRPTSRWIDVDTAAYLLGRDFAGDEPVLQALLANQQAHWTTDNVLWAVCEGWPSSSVVKAALEELRASNSRDGVIQIGGLLDMQVVCAQGTAKEMVESLIGFLSRLHADLSYHFAAFLRPVVRRIKGDGDVQSLLKDFLARSESAGVALGIAAIVGKAIGLEPELKAWCTERALAPGGNSTIYSPVGFDLTVGGVRTAWEVATELLSGGGENASFL